MEATGGAVAGIFDVPAVEPFHFDAAGLGSLPKTVNLFRGDVNFKVPLVSLSGRNGLDVAVTALYRSDVEQQATLWNRDAPTGVLGLGWDLPVDRIVARSDGSANREGNSYYFVRDGGWTRLYRTSRGWVRAEVPLDLAGELEHGTVGQAVATALLEQGLAVDPAARVDPATSGSAWRVLDRVHERTLAIARRDDVLAVSDGGLAYESQTFDFSRIRYYPEFERWEITHANSITTVFGGGSGDAVEWGVRWGNWSGPSALTHDPVEPSKPAQERYATAWNLSGSYTQWGDTVAFEYEQVSQPVGADGLSYTKACYPSRIVDVFGRTVSFEYGEKEFVADQATGPREYFDPNKQVPDDTPDAYQSRYETRFLSGLTVRSEQGVTLFSLAISYQLASFAPLGGEDPPSLSGDTVKRTPVKITKALPGGGALPPLELGYSSAADPHPGALRSITYPEGGTSTYVYERTELSSCERAEKIDAPFGGATPRVWFGPDYTVVAWYDGVARLRLSVHTWIGRWREWVPPSGDIEGAIELAGLEVEAEEDFFVLHYAAADGRTSSVWAFHKDERVLGSWLAHAANPIVLETVDRELASGSDFFAVCDRRAQTVTAYAWNALAASWESEPVPEPCDPAIGGERRLFVTGGGRALGVLCYDVEGAPGSKQSRLTLRYLDELGAWRAGDAVVAPEIELADPRAGFSWASAPWAFAATFVTQDLEASLRYGVAAYTWSAEADRPYRLRPVARFEYELPKRPDGSLPVPLQATISPTGLLASGPHLLRYNGAEWLRNDNLELVETADAETLFWIAAGADVAVKTESSPRQVLAAAQAYDPNTQARVWDAPAISLYDDPPADPRRPRYFPTAASDFLSWDLEIFARGTSTDWAEPLRAGPLRRLEESVDTTTVVNEGPDFLAYLVHEAAGDAVSGTQVLPIRNGAIVRVEEIPERFFQVIRSDGSLEPEIDGKNPAAPGGFVSFLPLDAEFDAAESIVLHRFLSGSAVAPVVDCPAVAVEFDDGFQTVTHQFAFDPDTAACDASGTVAKYYRSSAWVGGADKASGWTEYSFVNGLSGAGAEGPSVLDGLPAAKRTFDAAGTEVASASTQWAVETSVVDPQDGSKLPIRGAWVVAVSATSVEDGVSFTSTYSYDPSCGQLAGEESTAPDALGQLERRLVRSRFGFQVYPALAHANNLSAVVQRTASVEVGSAAAVVTSSQATSWRSFPCPTGSAERPVWAPGGRWLWLGGEGSADFPFTAQQVRGAPDGWLQALRVAARGARGLPLESEGPPGVVSSILYDRLEGLAVASFTRARVEAGEACYFGFEEYEQTERWPLDQATTPIVSTSANCGNRSLSIPAGTRAVPLRLTPSGGARHLFSFWARTEAGGGTTGDRDPAPSAGWRVTVAGSPLPIVPIAVADGWTYYARLLDLTGHGDTVEVELTAFNDGPEGVFVDDVAFAGYEGQLSVNVYDEPLLRRTAVLGPYDALSRGAYDDFGRQLARTDASEGVVEALAPYLARQDGAAPSPARPNQQTVLQPAGETLFERFADGDGWRSRWQATPAAQWSVVAGRLRYAGGAGGSVELCAPALGETFFLQACVEPEGEVAAGLGVGVGKATVLWDPAAGQWTLSDGSGGSVHVAAPGPGNSWVLAVTDAALIFLVDGRPVFTAPGKPPSGPPRLLAASPVAFDRIVAGSTPRIAASFFDGAARQRQGHSIESASSTVTAQLFDEIGRPAVHTKAALLAASADNPLLSFRTDFVTGFDWETGLLTGALADALPGDEGYPYVRSRFEESPLSRVVESGLPGKPLAITTAPIEQRRTTRVSFGANQAGGFPVDMGLPGGEYREVTRLNPDGVATVTVSDKRGQRVADGLLLDPASGQYLTSSYLNEYSAAGQSSTVRLPNYHEPPDATHRDSWVRTTNCDMRGLTVSKTAPDSGASAFVYDPDGNLRFSQDAAGAAAGQVTYRLYDQVGRPLEIGTIAIAFSAPALQQKADQDPGWPRPGDGAVPRSRLHFDGDGTEVRQMGLLSHAVRLGDAGAETTIRYEHDRRTRVAAVEESGPGDSQARRTTYSYDNLGNVQSSTYPSGTTITAQRDGAGRLSALADGSGILASYEWDAADRLQRETTHPGTAAELATAYSYASPGWLEATESPLLAQRLQYTEGGYKGASYYSGKVARREVALTIAEPGEFAAGLAYEYAYDNGGRLLTARALAGEQERPDLSLGLASPISYDANGNFLTVPTGSGEDAYRYPPGSDFASGTSPGGAVEYEAGPDGSATTARPHGVSSIDYDPVSRLPLTIATQGNGLIALEYDPRGRRAAKRTAQGTRVYSRGLGAASLVEELRPPSGAASSTEYLYGPTGLLAIREAGRTLTVLHDHLRSPLALVDESGAIVAAAQYLPFGSFAGPTFGTASAMRYGFAGYELDAETGLYSAAARLYDPQLRRFLGVDPKLQFASPYVYGGGDPIAMLDPDGRSAWWAMLLGAFVGALVTVATGGLGGFAGATIFGAGTAAASAADVATAMVVGGIAGSAGAVSGDAVTAAASHESFTGMRALTDALSGLVGGAVGAGVGSLAGAGAIALADENALAQGAAAAERLATAKMAGTAASLLAGGASGMLSSAGTASVLTGQPFFGPGPGASIAAGLIGGFGAAMLGSGAYLGWAANDILPRPLGVGDFGKVSFVEDLSDLAGEPEGQNRMLTFVRPEEYAQTQQKITTAGGDEGSNAVFRLVRAENPGFVARSDVIALHGVGRAVTPWTIDGFRRPMAASVFGEYLQTQHAAWLEPARQQIPVKALICFGAQPFGSSGSLGSQIANALGRPTFAGRGWVIPAESVNAQNWVQF